MIVKKKRSWKTHAEVSFDGEAGAFYVKIPGRKIVKTIEISEKLTVLMDQDENGGFVGLEIISVFEDTIP